MMYNIDSIYEGRARVRSCIWADRPAAAHARARELLRNMPGIDDSLYIGALSYEVSGVTIERIRIATKRGRR
jgi:hypothetical protein